MIYEYKIKALNQPFYTATFDDRSSICTSIDLRPVPRSILDICLNRSSIFGPIDPQSVPRSILYLYHNRSSMCTSIDPRSLPQTILDLCVNRSSIFVPIDPLCIDRSSIFASIFASIDPSTFGCQHNAASGREISKRADLYDRRLDQAGSQLTLVIAPHIKYESINIKVLNISPFYTF